MNWISITDKLPQDIDNVLAYSTCSNDENVRVEVAYFDRETNEWCGAPKYFLKDITHWMPLPEPPKS